MLEILRRWGLLIAWAVVTIAGMLGKISDLANAPANLKDLSNMWLVQALTNWITIVALIWMTLIAWGSGWFDRVWSGAPFNPQPNRNTGENTTEPGLETSARKSEADLPYDVDARSALQYAISRTWVRTPQNSHLGPDFPAEVERSFVVLEKFYQLASAGPLHVWGRTDRTRPHKPIETTHWQEWQIEHSSIFADQKSDPLRTVPRDKLPRDSFPYFDLRLNKAEVENFWPPHDFVPILEVAKIAFEETGLFSDVSMGGELRLFQFVVLMIMEARANPSLLEIWGAQVPSEKMKRVPTEILQVRNFQENGSEIHLWGEFGPQLDWVKVSIPRFQIAAFIERLRREETAGQQPDSDGPKIKTRSTAIPQAPPDLKMIAVRFRDRLGAQPPYNQAKEIFLSDEAERIRERVMAEKPLEPYAKELWDAARALLGCYESLWVKSRVRRNSPGADPGEVKYGYEWGYTHDPMVFQQILTIRAKLADAASAILNLETA